MNRTNQEGPPHSSHLVASSKWSQEDSDNGAGIRSLSDARLVVAMVHRQEDALAETYERHGASVYRGASDLCGPAHADQMTREVFFALWRAPESFDLVAGSLRSALLTETYSRSSDLLRGQRLHRGRSTTVPAKPSVADGAPGLVQPSEVAHQGDISSGLSRLGVPSDVGRSREDG
jgi:DNA-directed RNA polymerase specialized sigma24 family protein